MVKGSHGRSPIQYDDNKHCEVSEFGVTVWEGYSSALVIR